MTAPAPAPANPPDAHRRERRLRRRIVATLIGLVLTGAAVKLWPMDPDPRLRMDGPVSPGGWLGRAAAASLSRGGPGGRREPPAAAAEPDATHLAADGAARSAGVETSVTPPPPKIQTYFVQPGDTAGGIAARFGLTTATVLWANDLADGSLLQIGSELRIPARDGLLRKIVDGDTLWDLSSQYQVDLDAVIVANPDVEPGALQLGHWLLLPGARPEPPAPVRAAVAAPAPEADAENGFDRWPLQGAITSYYGNRIHPVYGTRAFHEGLDIAGDTGDTIRAVAAGQVTLAGWYGGWGLSVKVDHGGGLATRYSHASMLLVKAGDRVVAGQPVARVGSTGISTGPHLDFGVYVGGRAQDPMDWLP